MDGDLFIKKHTGNYMIYPGHPLVLACAIMHQFKGIEAAIDRQGLGYEAAMASNNIPGAGCHVHAALTVLKKGAEGCSVDEMVLHANEYWVRGNAGGHDKNVEAGIDQAKALEKWFREHITEWYKIKG